MYENKEVIREAAATVGGMAELARLLGVTRAAVSAWPRVPAERVLMVEKFTKVSRFRIRPDVFGEGRKKRGAT